MHVAGRISRALKLVNDAEALADTRAGWISGVRSPWSGSSLSRVVALDVFGERALGDLTRGECMAIPALARGRNKLVTSIARGVLRQLEGDTPSATQPEWLFRTDGRTSPQHRIVWTVDDLIFGGWSLWAVTRSGSDPLDPITDAGRAPADSWRLGDGGVVELRSGSDWVPVEDESTVVLIPGFHEGLLTYGTRSIRAASELEETVAALGRNPIPAVELHQTTDDELTPAEIDDLVDAWQEAVTSTGGAVAYTPKSIEVRVHGTASADLLIQGRNAAAIDAARALGIPAATLDASNVNSTLTYETQEGRNLEYREDSIGLYADPITARLSMDDVCPRGSRVAFDFGDLTTPAPAVTGPTRQD